MYGLFPCELFSRCWPFSELNTWLNLSAVVIGIQAYATLLQALLIAKMVEMTDKIKEESVFYKRLKSG